MEVLFICKGNVGRSQMARAFFEGWSRNHRAICAGTHVGENDGQALSPFHMIVECMAELGYDINSHRRRQLTQELVQRAGKIVVMTDQEDLPDFARDLPETLYWDVTDPKDTPYEFHRRIRDEIRKLVEALVREIG